MVPALGAPAMKKSGKATKSPFVRKFIYPDRFTQLPPASRRQLYPATRGLALGGDGCSLAAAHVVPIADASAVVRGRRESGSSEGPTLLRPPRVRQQLGARAVAITTARVPRCSGQRDLAAARGPRCPAVGSQVSHEPARPPGRAPGRRRRPERHALSNETRVLMICSPYRHHRAGVVVAMGHFIASPARRCYEP